MRLLQVKSVWMPGLALQIEIIKLRNISQCIGNINKGDHATAKGLHLSAQASVLRYPGNVDARKRHVTKSIVCRNPGGVAAPRSGDLSIDWKVEDALDLVAVT